MSVIGWNTIYFGFEWLVKPIVFGQISEPKLPTETCFFDSLLMGRAASGSLGKIR